MPDDDREWLELARWGQAIRWLEAQTTQRIRQTRWRVGSVVGGSVTILAAVTLCMGTVLTMARPHDQGTYQPGGTLVTQVPISITHDCSGDVTAALTNFFAALPSNTSTIMPSSACYLVSNSPSLLFQLNNLTGLSINGNGSTLEQTSYAGANARQPVLWLNSDSNLSISNLTLQGSSGAGGAGNEGNYGVLMMLNHGVTLDNVTITGVDGDGVGIYPPLSSQVGGVNYDVTINNSNITPGYHAVTPESVKNLMVENTTIHGGDIDAEVDWSCQSTWPTGCGTIANPLVGVVNMTFNNDSFPNGFIFYDGLSCMPISNWSFTNNNFGAMGMSMQFPTAGNTTLATLQTCGYVGPLTITGNTSTNSGIVHQGGSPWILINGWNNVTISGNTLAYASVDPWVSWCSDENIAVKTNAVHGPNPALLDTGQCSIRYGLTQPPWPANVNATHCGNTWGPNLNLNDGAC